MIAKISNVPLMLRGKLFSAAELSQIRRIARRYFSKGRTRISVEICKKLSWKQANGWLKDRACRDVLLRLEREKMITLPKRRNEINNLRQNHIRPEIENWIDYSEIKTITTDLLLVLAKGDESEAVWNHLIAKHHYIGHKVIVGRCLKFLVYAGDRIVAALSLSDPSWAVGDRDEVLKTFGIQRSAVANNSRFLILPNIKVKNLASRVLAVLAREAVYVWEGYYSTELKCLETYVDSDRFEATSYRAANWIGVGLSKGFRKNGTEHENGQSKKFVLLYPLDLKTRRDLYKRHLICHESKTS